MWCVRSLERRNRVLDFTSSGQGQRSVVALYADGQRVINALSLVELHDPEQCQVQAEVCEECGITHCAPGGWISLRRFGHSVLWVPCFTKMLVDEWSRSEYAPPRYPGACGLPLFPGETYREMREYVPCFPPPEAIPAISARDAVWLLQTEAPGLVLGRFPEPAIPIPQRFLAAGVGDLATQLEALKQTLAIASASRGELIEQVSVTPILFYLDLPGTPEWTPIASAGSSFALAVAAGRFALPVAEAD